MDAGQSQNRINPIPKIERFIQKLLPDTSRAAFDWQKCATLSHNKVATFIEMQRSA